MKINWGPIEQQNSSGIRSILATEYSFRTTVTKLCLQNISEDLHDHLEDIQFDICSLTKCFKLSTNTPEPLHSAVQKIIASYLPKYGDYTYEV